MGTWIQINNINEGDLEAGDSQLEKFAADDTRFVEIIEGDWSKVYAANFDKPLTRNQLLKNLGSENVTHICVSKDTKDDLDFFAKNLPKTKWEQRKGYFSSDVVFALK